MTDRRCSDWLVLILIWGGIGTDVEILRRAPQQQIAHAAADQIGFVALAGQAVHHLESMLVNILARNAVLSARQNNRQTSF